MSFQAYIDNIQAKTGKTPSDFKVLAEEKGYIVSGELVVKAGVILDWLKSDFDLGHGHAMAIYATLKGRK
jgi:DNA topoisomerase VI subunit A